MTSRDPHLRLPSWLIAASLAVLVVATLTYFITSSNDNTDEAAPPSDRSTSASDEPPEPKQTEKADEPKKPKKDKGSDRKADKPAEKKKPAKKKPAKPQPQPNATVDVYNNSGITNLAASVSSDVRTAGFSIGGVDNWYGSIPESTVYYPRGMEEQAKLLASDLGLSRTMPAIDPMATDRLSLILTAAI